MLKANERRQKILEILCVRRQETMENLAQEFNVTKDTLSTVRFTDVMLQGGLVATAWVSHVSEQRYTFDAQEV